MCTYDRLLLFDLETKTLRSFSLGFLRRLWVLWYVCGCRRATSAERCFQFTVPPCALVCFEPGGM